MCLWQLFNVEGRSDRDYLNQMERDACLTYIADQVPPLPLSCQHINMLRVFYVSSFILLNTILPSVVGARLSRDRSQVRISSRTFLQSAPCLLAAVCFVRSGVGVKLGKNSRKIIQMKITLSLSLET
jgi:hypothetical protein